MLFNENRIPGLA